MRRLIFVSILSTLPLVACDEGIDPASGTWDFSAGEQTQNTCNYDGIGGRSGLFQVTNEGDGRLTIDPEDGTDPFECTLDGADFDCPERFQDEQDVTGYDATLVVHASARGTFGSSTAASGTQHGRVECEGSDCAGLATAVGATLPCEFTEKFTASFEE
jgi:hypothetical protein